MPKGDSMRRFRFGNTDLWKVAILCVLAFVLLAGRRAPETADGQLAFGVEMAKRGLWSEALFRFKQAERLRPGDPKILNNMAVAFEALGNFEKALEHYQKAITADRSNSELKRNYSRFIEFYRAFKPEVPEAESSTGQDESSGA